MNTWFVWWNTEKWDNTAKMYIANILKVLPYTGRYPQFFNRVLRLEAPGTHKGWLEMAVKLRKKDERKYIV